MTRTIVIDTETTGLDPGTDKIIEIAAVHGDGRTLGCLLDPGDVRISFGAMGTHHITPAMVEGQFDIDRALLAVGLDDGKRRTEDLILVAHNAPFDRGFLPAWLHRARWICTYRCALHLVPEAESHGNGSLWYELGLDHTMPEAAGRMPHRALFDALMTSDILRRFTEMARAKLLLNDGDMIIGDAEALAYLIELSTAPVILTKCRFGKHRDALWSDIPSDYMRWVLGQDFDADTLHTCRHWLKTRGHN